MSGYAERKRPNVFGEDPEQHIQGGPKKVKGNTHGIPSYVPPPLTSLPGLVTPTGLAPGSGNMAIDIAAKRAEIQAKLAAMTSKGGLNNVGANGGVRQPSSIPPPPPPPSSSSQGSSSSRNVSSGLPAVPGLPKPNLDPDLAKKIADARMRVEQMQAKKRAALTPVNPYLSTPVPRKNDPISDPSIAARGGLGMTAHPLLMDSSTPAASSKKDRYKPMVPKFSTTKANTRLPPAPSSSSSSSSKAATPIPVTPMVPDLIETPYYDPRLGNGSAGVSGRSHMGRGHARDSLKFNQKGKFIRLGEAIRAEAKMEELKKRILESARKAGLESEMEDQAKVIKRPAPPEIEWWDAPFLPKKSYDSYSEDFLDNSAAITIYVQHPIQIPAPSDKFKVEPKALFLTKKEMKKMRRQRRLADLQDKQDRIKMGLLPPDPPKVKLSNMMRVLTQDAISDPTKIEAKVRREMVARQRGHLKANESRKLTHEEKNKKIEAKMVDDDKRGIGAMCFKIRYLSNPAHKFKVKKNAIDFGLTGVIIHNPQFCLVVIEGGAKSLKPYKRLMLHRIDWTEETRVRGGEDETESTAPPVEVNGNGSGAGVNGAGTSERSAMDELEEPQSLADNYCVLVWEGQHRERMFNSIRNANCPSMVSAKETLGVKLEGLWDVARTFGKDEDD